MKSDTKYSTLCTFTGRLESKPTPLTVGLFSINKYRRLSRSRIDDRVLRVEYRAEAGQGRWLRRATRLSLDSGRLARSSAAPPRAPPTSLQPSCLPSSSYPAEVYRRVTYSRL
ncbi:hypothetical protein EVAR_32948_1 [Eumeta japonica]|uniref:Uncharacterized protein n=1 Tax=Eumeta variegata TaxID=151549 RepID=A0A4C1X6W7_EUMVA|nr:hypothetical protein EVAR_32948_1 [Eumeta japonica]